MLSAWMRIQKNLTGLPYAPDERSKSLASSAAILRQARNITGVIKTIDAAPSVQEVCRQIGMPFPHNLSRPKVSR
jgi:hypothetical protein